ncbi:hypothetical protein BESB_045740 [Besnoitia besnoiti]|uniref:Uncharacterized protein n=1 Tax=Besnoitia besnoiti TaxID=94643 RepID=A0A2A9MLP1_BESBE|nr:hypothetical protein BESB_045740 [Besnoitia besnoiti]PFH36382.1 hypothetical protein BESB_045740 [Besnoitia besnoiti]
MRSDQRRLLPATTEATPVEGAATESRFGEPFAGHARAPPPVAARCRVSVSVGQLLRKPLLRRVFCSRLQRCLTLGAKLEVDPARRLLGLDVLSNRW